MKLMSVSPQCEGAVTVFEDPKLPLPSQCEQGLKVLSHCAAAAMVPLSIGFQPHSVRQWQWQNNILCNAKYFATATAAQNGVGTYLLVTPVPQPLPKVLV